MQLPGQQLGRGDVVLDDQNEGSCRVGSGAVDLLIRRRNRRDLKRKPQCKHAALADLAGHADVASVQEGEPARKREAEAGTLLAPPGAGVDLMKLHEDLGLVGVGDADAGVGHGDLDRALQAARTDLHGAALSCELDGVGDQVQQHLLELARVGQHHACGRGLRADGEVLLRRQRLDERERLRDDRLHRHLLQPKLHLTGLDLRQVEDVVDQAKQVLAAGVDLGEEPLLSRAVELRFLRVEHQLREADDGVQRSPQLVAHVREEHALVLAGVLELAVGILELFHQSPAVHACGHRGHELLHTIHLVVADRRGERPGHHDQASDALEAVDRKRDQCHRLAAAALIPADAVGQVGQQLLQLLSEVRVDAGGGARVAATVKRYSAAPASEAHRPFEGAAIGSGGLVAHEEAFHECAEAFFL